MHQRNPILVNSGSYSPIKSKRNFSFKSITQTTTSSKTLTQSPTLTSKHISSKSILPSLQRNIGGSHSRSSPYIGKFHSPQRKFKTSNTQIKQIPAKVRKNNSPLKSPGKVEMLDFPLLEQREILKPIQLKLNTQIIPGNKQTSLDITQTDDERSEISVVWDNQDLDERRLRSKLQDLSPTELFVFLYKYRSEQHPNIKQYLPTERLKIQVNKFGNQGKRRKGDLMNQEFAQSDLINADYSSPQGTRKISQATEESKDHMIN